MGPGRQLNVRLQTDLTKLIQVLDPPKVLSLSGILIGKQSAGSSNDLGKLPSSEQHSMASPASSKNISSDKKCLHFNSVIY